MATKQPVVLPPNRAWTQANTGYLFGSIYSSRNVNLEIPGIISLSRRMKALYRENSTGSNFDSVLAITYGAYGATASGFSSANGYIVLTNDQIYFLAANLNNMGQMTNVGTPGGSLRSDGMAWNGGYYMTTNTQIASLIAGTWVTTGIGALTTNLPHPLEMGAISQDLFIGNGNLLKRLTIGAAYTTAITLPANFQITWIRSNNNRVLIGTKALDATNAAVFEWDEVATTWTNRYDVDAPWVYSGCFRNTDAFITVSDGRIMKFNGGGFSEVARWPIYKTLQGYWDENFTAGLVFNRGMNIIGGRVNVMVNGDVNFGQYGSPNYENFSSGVWEYDESTGLNHKYGVSFSQTGEDYSQMILTTGAGAVYPVVTASLPDPATGSILLTGARVYGGILDYFTLNTPITGGTNRGQFTTTRIETTDIADNLMKIWCKYRGVYTANDTIIFKYKDQTINHFPFTTAADVTWTSSTVFTSTDTNFQYVIPGYEVTIFDGVAAGAAAHVSTISLNAGTYTVTLDEAMPNVINGDTSTVDVDNFTRLEVSITSADTLGYKDIPIEQADARTWIQIKVEMRGSENVVIEEMQVVDQSHVLATP